MQNVRLLNYYLFLFFGFVFITIVLSFRILWYVWKVQNGFRNVNQRDPNYRKSLYCFQMRFYFISLIYFLLNHISFEYHPVFVVVAGAMLVPQIVFNLKRQVQSLDFNFSVYFMIPHFFIFLYYRGCPYNLSNLAPYPVVTYSSLGILFLSVIVLHLQSIYGSMFFVPKRCLKKQYNYFIKKEKLKKYFQKNFKEQNMLESKENTNSGFKSCCLRIFLKKKEESEAEKMEKLDDSIEIQKLDAIKVPEQREIDEDGPKAKVDLNETLDEEKGSEAKAPDQGKSEGLAVQDLQVEKEPKTEEVPNLDLNTTMDLLNEENCMICLGNVYDPASLGELGQDKNKFFKNSLFKNLCKRYRKTHRMKTPCQHFYHTGKERTNL